MLSFGSRVHSIFRVSILVVVCALAAVETSSAILCTEGGPQATYQFVGQCAPNDCTGTGVGLLTVQNYTLGTALTNCNFVSFTYTSNVVGSFTITPSTLVGLSGTLPSSLPATATVYVLGPGSNELYTNVSGSWGVGRSDYGPTGLWGVYSTTTAVPTLSTAAWFALGLLLAGAGALLARSRRTARA